jgi:hypothetical protein
MANRLLLATAAVVCGLATQSFAAGPTKPKSGETCGRHGTEVAFVDTPSEAASQARRDEKLVFVLHVSGHFENPEFT